jgi:hypothetical protein
VLGDELQNAAVEILKLDGAKRLPQALSSGLLVRATDARIVVLLDNIDRQYLDAWAEAIQLGKLGQPERMLPALRSLQSADALEVTMLYALAAEAIKARAIDRIVPFGLSKPDIIEYLDPAALGLGHTTWEALVGEWRRSETRDFKQFLHQRGGRINVEGLTAAATQLDHVPEEFAELLELCR